MSPFKSVTSIESLSADGMTLSVEYSMRGGQQEVMQINVIAKYNIFFISFMVLITYIDPPKNPSNLN